jgi:hypothetical protein
MCTINNIKSIIQLYRHGARTSSSIGRQDDTQLALMRKGLTFAGYSQFYYLGNRFFQKYINNYPFKFKFLNMYLNEKDRVIYSSYAFLDGFLNKFPSFLTSLDERFIEQSFSEKILPHKLYDPTSKYLMIKEKHNFNQINKRMIEFLIEYNKNHTLQLPMLPIINFKSDKNIFNKTLISSENVEIMKKRYKAFDTDNNQHYTGIFREPMQKLILDDLDEGIYDFKKKKIIDKPYFHPNEFSIKEIKLLTDFIRCNKFYEDIPIYKPEYMVFSKKLKEFLIDYYHHSSTFEDLICYQRIKYFLKEVLKICEQNESSVNIFVNHNTALRSLIKFMLSDEGYKELSQKALIEDRYFFLLVPTFGGSYKFEIMNDNYLKMYANDNYDMTKYLKNEFKINKDGQWLISLDNFVYYLNKKFDF